MSATHRTHSGQDCQLPNGLAFDDQGNPIRTFWHSPIDDMEPLPDSGEFTKDAEKLARLISFCMEGRTTQEVGTRFLGVVQHVRPDQLKGFPISTALLSKWANRFRDELGFKGIALRSEATRQKCRKNALARHRKRKGKPPEHEAQAALRSETTNDQEGSSHSGAAVNAPEKGGE